MKRVNTPHWETSDGFSFECRNEAMLHEAILDMAVLIRDDLGIDLGLIDGAKTILDHSDEWMRVISLMRRRAKCLSD